MHKLILFMSLALAGCQTAQQRRLDLIKDRVEKLQPLSTWPALECRVEARLTEPARARYREMFPAEIARINQPSLIYDWRARESSCEVKPAADTPLTRNHRGFVETALCQLLQTHWVNSPFDDLKAGAGDIVDGPNGKTLIRSGRSGELGILIDPANFRVETRTKSHGILQADYAPLDGAEWLPRRISQVLHGTPLELDEFQWAYVQGDGRRLLKSVWIGVGEGEVHPQQHTQLVFEDCHPL